MNWQGEGIPLPNFVDAVDFAVKSQQTFIVRTLCRDEAGSVISTELVVVAAISLIGILAGLTAVRDAMVSELSDISGAVQDSNQSFSYTGITGSSTDTAGSSFFDALDIVDSVDDPTGQADNCITFDSLPVAEILDPVVFNANFEEGIDFDDAIRRFGRGPSAFLFRDADISGWQTTARDGVVEIWESGFGGVESQSAGFHAEINANRRAQLFQEFKVLAGDVVFYSIWHRGRAGVDTANILIGPVGNQVFQQQIQTGNQAWANYTGRYDVPDGVDTLRIGFESVSTATGNQSVGNFIDNLQVQISR
jgi:hypothetical protein